MADFRIRVSRSAKSDYRRMLADIDSRLGANEGKRQSDLVFWPIKSQFDRGARTIVGTREIRITTSGGRVYRTTIDGWRVYFQAYVPQERLWIYRIRDPLTPIP